MTAICIDVLLPLASDQVFTYQTPVPLARGTIVEVPLRKSTKLGIVWGQQSASTYPGALREVIAIHQTLPASLLDFIGWVSQYTMTPLGLLGKSLLRDFAAFTPGLSEAPHYHQVPLSAEQESALQIMRVLLSKQDFAPMLLEGVTGAGKTEVYFHILADVLAAGKQALVILPEIALTDQIVNRFRKRFSQPPLLWHSGLTPVKRRTVWQSLLQGQPQVVVGARSALFLPLQNLGLIVVDEEHDPSYKQEEQILYQARDMAIVRAQLTKVPIILASATPSLETIVNVQTKGYTHIKLMNRHGGASFPTVKLVDMRAQASGWISLPLQAALATALKAQQQSMLFLNRRGYAPLTLCRACGHRLMCPNCTSWLVLHKLNHKLNCHYCGYKKTQPSQCLQCQAEDCFIACGPGVERVEEAVAQAFPEARLLLLTSDTLTTPKKIQAALQQIIDHQVDIVIGTQLLAKGHHFPLMTVIGIIDGDLGLTGGDLRASERTFQLLHQVSGRAGRAQLTGAVYLQTYQPDHPVIHAIARGEVAAFCERELQERRLAEMPPFARLVSIIISGLSLQDTEATAQRLVKSAHFPSTVNLWGPVPAALFQLRGRYRFRLLLKAPKSLKIQPYIKSWLAQVKAQGNTRIIVDIDPYGFL